MYIEDLKLDIEKTEKAISKLITELAEKYKIKDLSLEYIPRKITTMNNDEHTIGHYVIIEVKIR